ncbi:MAG: DNA-directed RNA polymerase subunit beta [Puniceicoccales bacterium]|jgi:DNA-directed RNA polymerase subunit beta|nr:DNA-directed RNA polymerase subunit beta [Puniceicoccales bacterium]
MSHRINFGKLNEVILPPDLIQLQLDSFREFLQADKTPRQRENVGLEAVFQEVFPIESYDNKFHLEYVSYQLVEPKQSDYTCIREGNTYSVSLYVTLRLKAEESIQESEIYMGEIPLMTERGSFIVNGAERVVVSQLHRSPGICFEQEAHTTGKILHSFRIIPDRGTWIEVQFDPNDLLYVYLDRRRRRRKFLVTTFLRALGFSGDMDILKLFYAPEKISVQVLLLKEDLTGYILVEDVIDATKGLVLARAFEPVTQTVLEAFTQSNIETVWIVDSSVDEGAIIRCLKKDTVPNEEEALRDIFRRLRPGDPATLANAKNLFKRLFFDEKRYDLGRVGRYRLNQKSGESVNLSKRLLQPNDIVQATRYLCSLKKGNGVVDDIDHLGSRRVRPVGELLYHQCRLGLSRTERIVKERMALYDQTVDTVTPQRLMNTKALATVVRDFFARSQLSQLMDQINPLAELTHKRRLSALGPGGLNRERAGFEVRDVHASHYGRICPIETPEGPNIGLINSLTTYAIVNEFGFIGTPYRVVKKGVVTDEVHYLTADQEEQVVVAQANSFVNKEGRLEGRITARKRFEVIEVDPKEVNYMDVSPKQLISVATGLIPFLEHDDAGRALMGSNMQRQGVPLLRAEAPFVGTGLEAKVAQDSRTVVVAEADGKVVEVDGKHIIVAASGTLPSRVDKLLKTDHKKGIYVYDLYKFIRSNATTCFNQRPLVRLGDEVKKGQILADGAATQDGELALGSNVLVAFMPWNGYNFEDAIILSERLVKEDVFTSIHIEEFEVTARDTKLGAEEITRDIPNVGEEALKNLDRNGIICVGAEVHPGDILVGKITPKSETELAPEEKLLRAIFGEKAADIKDSSMIAPPGCSGIVMDVRTSLHADKEDEEESVETVDYRRKLKKITEEQRTAKERLREELTEALSNILLGEKIPLNIIHQGTGEIIIPANRKITKTLLRRLASAPDSLQIEQSPVKVKIVEILNQFKKRFELLDEEYEAKIRNVEEEGEETGTIKNVKVYIAVKRKIQVGDKMAGRHGNKGVVAQIVPVQDMPFLADGTPVDIILNPLGIPSRMNVGQVLETHLGWACRALGIKIATPVFDGVSEDTIRAYLKKANLPESGKITLYDGCTGEAFFQKVMVGCIYMMKLNHLVANKIHARAVGPYSLITQQPLGGKAQYGGQRFGEMEVWALEAYGAAYNLQELLTVKSDDVQGRTRVYEAIVKGHHSLQAGVPQSFNVLVKEMQGLCLDVRLGSKQQQALEDVRF